MLLLGCSELLNHTKFQNVLSITHREGEIPLLLVRLAPVRKLQQVGLRQVGHQVGLRQTQAFPVET